MRPSRTESEASRFELATTYLLIIGVFSSLILVGIGMILFYLHFGRLEISENNFFQSVAGILQLDCCPG